MISRLFCAIVLAIAAAVAAAPASAKTKYNFTGSTFGAQPKSRSGYSGSLFSGRTTKTTVAFKTSLKPGSIVIRTRERKLYYVLPGGKALRYGVGVGRAGFTWKGRNRVSRKQEWPDWIPPKEMIAREKRKYGRTLPDRMPGGPNNPLGARAIYLGGTLYRIHGTNAAQTIGHAVSSGCIRMLNDEVIDLYGKVKIGAMVVVE